jgi:hypothetical protein
VADDLAELGPGQVLTVYGFRHRLVNVNSVALHQLLAEEPVGGAAMVDPAAVPNDEHAMAGFLTTGVGGGACLLLTARGTSLEFEPVVDADLMAAAAREAGFARRTTVRLPDDRTVVVWRRTATCPVTGGTAPAP